MEKEYLSCAETAKLVRAALKKKFPGIKFSVTSDVYSMGASIDIGWSFGPTTKEVDAIGRQYASASFDGMIDMEVHWNHWLLPDGTVQLRSGPGSESSMGYIAAVAETPMPEGSRPVSFGAHYVQSQRSFAPKGQYEMETVLRTQIAKDMCALQHVEYKGEYTIGLYGSGDDKPICDHASQLLYATSFPVGEVYAGVRYATNEERESDHDSFQVMRIITKKAASNGG